MADIPFDYKQLYKTAMDLASKPDIQKIINSDPSLKEAYENMINHPESDASIFFMSSLTSFFQEAEAAAKKNVYLKELKTIIPELYNLDEKQDKITAQIDSLREQLQPIREEYSKKLNEFTNIYKQVKDIPNIKEEILKIPHAEKYINITSAQAKRIGKRVAQESAITLSARKVIDPLTGNEYKTHTEFCNTQIEENKKIGNEKGVASWDYAKDSAARVIRNNLRYWFLPATEENVDLVNNCLSTPPCIQELQNNINTVKKNYELKQEPNELTKEDILAILRKYKH